MEFFSLVASGLLVAEEIDPASVKPGWTSGAVISLMLLAGAILFFSFVKQMKKLREPWEGEVIKVLPDPRIPVGEPDAVVSSVENGPPPAS